MTCDQFITENSNFLKYVQYGDVIMADRGFNIAETLGTFGAKLEILSFIKGKNQLRPEEVEDTRTIVNVQFKLNV